MPVLSLAQLRTQVSMFPAGKFILGNRHKPQGPNVPKFTNVCEEKIKKATFLNCSYWVFPSGWKRGDFKIMPVVIFTYINFFLI